MRLSLYQRVILQQKGSLNVTFCITETIEHSSAKRPKGYTKFTGISTHEMVTYALNMCHDIFLICFFQRMNQDRHTVGHDLILLI